MDRIIISELDTSNLIAIVVVVLSVVINDVLNGIGDILNIASGQTGDRDSAVRGHVDVVLVDHLLALLGSESQEREHTDLVGNVVPGALAAILN